MEIYAGIDLRSTNSYIGIIDEQDQRHLGKRLPLILFTGSLNPGIDYLNPAITLEETISPGSLKIDQWLGGDRLLGGFPICLKFFQP